MSDPLTYDCQQCGACCANLPSNREIGFSYWVQIKPEDKILTRRDLVRKFVTYDRKKEPHLRLAANGQCMALRGSVGGEVACGIYHQRPSPCRRVQPGDGSCLRSRKEHGLPVPEFAVIPEGPLGGRESDDGSDDADE